MLLFLNNRFCCLNTVTKRGLKLFFREVKKKKKTTTTTKIYVKIKRQVELSDQFFKRGWNLCMALTSLAN